MRCSAHILNLIVKDGLDVIKEGIEKISCSVLYWTCTPRRVERFHDTAKHLKMPVDNKLVLDCPTRWNSTYDMLSVAIRYKGVFFRLKQRDSQYTSLPSNDDWEFALVVCQKLEIFSVTTYVFFGLNYPTVTLFFAKVCDIRMSLMAWLYDPNPLICELAEKMWMKFAKYSDDIHLLLAISVVLDPRYKLDIIEYNATKFGSTDTHIIGENIKLLVCDLVLEYQRKSERNSNIAFGSGVAVATRSAMDLDFDLYQASLFHGRGNDVYLSWIKDDTNRDKDIKMEELEGIFNALIMEDTSVEDIEEHKQSDEDKVESYNLDD